MQARVWMLMLISVSGCLPNRVAPAPARSDCPGGADCVDDTDADADTHSSPGGDIDVREVTISHAAEVYNTSALRCDASVVAPPGAAVSVDYAWTNTTRASALGVTQDLSLDPDVAAPGDVIRCTVSADDGNLVVFRSATVTLGNRPPEVQSVLLSEEQLRPGDTVSCVVSASDPDADALTIDVRWSTGEVGVDLVVPTEADAPWLICTATVTDPHGGEVIRDSTNEARLILGPTIAEVSPVGIGFGARPLACPADPEGLVVTNVSDTDILTVIGASLVGSDASAFTFSGPELPAMVLPGASVVFEVGFLGTTPGSYVDAALILQLDDPGEPESGAVLFGERLPDVATSDVFTQAAARSFDLLAVIDNSCSMAMHHPVLSTQLQGFITSVDAYGDWRLAVTTADTESDTHGGGTTVGRGLFMGPWMTPATPDLADEVAAQVDVGTDGSSTAAGLEAAQLALTPPMADAAPNQGFLRSDARLVVVFVSDDDDASTGDVASYLNALWALKPDPADVLLTGLTGPASCNPSDACPDAAGSPTFVGQAPRYHAAFAQTDGVWADLGQHPFDEFFAEVWRRAQAPPVDFTLSNPVADASSVAEVTVDGVSVPMSSTDGFTVSGEVLSFHGDAVPAPGAQVQIDYAYRPPCP